MEDEHESEYCVSVEAFLKVLVVAYWKRFQSLKRVPSKYRC